MSAILLNESLQFEFCGHFSGIEIGAGRKKAVILYPISGGDKKGKEVRIEGEET